MSEIPLEVLKAIKAMNEEKFLNAMATGNASEAAQSLKRMTYALSQIDQYKSLCGDHLVEIGMCGCKI